MSPRKASKPVAETPEQKANREIIEGIAGNIMSLARSVSALLNGPLKKQTLLVLLSYSSDLSQEKVGRVLKALENLELDWLNKR